MSAIDVWYSSCVVNEMKTSVYNLGVRWIQSHSGRRRQKQGIETSVHEGNTEVSQSVDIVSQVSFIAMFWCQVAGHILGLPHLCSSNPGSWFCCLERLWSDHGHWWPLCSQPHLVDLQYHSHGWHFVAFFHVYVMLGVLLPGFCWPLFLCFCIQSFVSLQYQYGRFDYYGDVHLLLLFCKSFSRYVAWWSLLSSFEIFSTAGCVGGCHGKPKAFKPSHILWYSTIVFCICCAWTAARILCQGGTSL